MITQTDSKKKSTPLTYKDKLLNSFKQIISFVDNLMVGHASNHGRDTSRAKNILGLYIFVAMAAGLGAIFTLAAMPPIGLGLLALSVAMALAPLLQEKSVDKTSLHPLTAFLRAVSFPPALVLLGAAALLDCGRLLKNWVSNKPAKTASAKSPADNKSTEEGPKTHSTSSKPNAADVDVNTDEMHLSPLSALAEESDEEEEDNLSQRPGGQPEGPSAKTP
ncbi:MAG: hypothetical protein DHS20C10_08490 [marine bacterium B5-7]|nr:MAG: hypothetical protein DHS20C10_08490 [marine bacterium B5-7]